MIPSRNHLEAGGLFAADDKSVQSTPPPFLNPDLCTHCSQPIPKPRRGVSRFCCAGCETVFDWIQASGLEHYYDLRDGSASSQPRRLPAQPTTEEFSFLDDFVFRKQQNLEGNSPSLSCFVEGLHCAACVWLIESLPRVCPELTNARVDLGRSVVRITLAPGGRFATVLQQLSKLGYSPHPLLSEGSESALQSREQRQMLQRIGVAAMGAANAMLFSTSRYAGASEGLAVFFQWIEIVVCFPVFAWSALPFYRAAWGALRARTVSIDLPISLALILGYAASVLHVLTGIGDLYLDALSGLTFLLLSSRYVLWRLQKNQLSGLSLLHVVAPSQVQCWRGAALESIPVERLSAGDQIQVSVDQVIPADGQVLEGEGFVDCSMINGESAPRRVKPGSPVLAGFRNLGPELRVRLLTDACHSSLGQLATAIADSHAEKANSVQVANQIAKYFVLALLFASIGVVFWSWQSDPLEGFRRAFCLLVVACPCSLALATPLTFAFAFRSAARSKILLKSPSVLERLWAVKTICVDKTGTLTYGAPRIIHCSEMSSEVASAVYSIESRSRHPIALALTSYLESQNGVTLKSVSEFRETPGYGVEGTVNGVAYRITRMSQPPQDGCTWISVSGDGLDVARVSLCDKIRPEAFEVLSELKRQYAISILSGDGKKAVDTVANALGIDAKHVYAECSPEQKNKIMQRAQPALMVGDGANDALALRHAHVGVAVRGSLEISLRAADVAILDSGLVPLSRLLRIAHEARKTLYRNYAFSITYNLIGATLAVSGEIGPLFAAVVMPLSALTVFLSASMGASEGRRLQA